jgi:Helicase associated domain
MDWSHLPFHLTGPAATLDNHHAFQLALVPPPPPHPQHHHDGAAVVLGTAASAEPNDTAQHAKMWQDENIRLKERLEQAERALKERDEQIVALQRRVLVLAELLTSSTIPPPAATTVENTGGVVTAAAAVPLTTAKLPVYGRNDNPIVTEKTGLLDGRSNADLAFDQKCHLLEEYRQATGHLHVKMTDAAKYVPLVTFIVKQRKYYRAYRNGELKSTVNLNRIRRLESLGFEWSRRPDYEAEFVKLFDQLVAFQQMHGHCCVNAIPNVDIELVKFVARQRKYLKDSKEKERLQQQQQQQRTNDDAEKDNGSPDADSVEDGSDTSGDDEEAEPAVTDPTGAGDEGHNGPTTTQSNQKKKNKQKRFLIPKHYTKSMQDRIELLQDPFITMDPNEMAPLADTVAKHCRTIKFLKQTKSYHPNSVGWYQRFEEFRAFRNEHGHGIVPLNNVKRDGLKNFVRLERALYQAIQRGVIDAHPLFTKNIQFLTDHGFVYDEVTIQKEEERLRALVVNQKREELYYATPRGQLELVEKDAEAVKERLQVAQEAKKAAEEAWSAIHKDYIKVKKKMREAEEKASHDPVGSMVHVRDRGPGKPGGMAKVTRYSVTKVLNELVKFFDVVYLDDGREDTFIEGRFVDDAKAVSALLDLSKQSDDDDDDDIQQPRQGAMTRNKRKAIITQAKPPTSPPPTTNAPSTTGDSGTVRPAKQRKMSGRQESPPPHLQVIDNMIPDQRSVAAAKPVSTPPRTQLTSSQHQANASSKGQPAATQHEKVSEKLRSQDTSSNAVQPSSSQTIPAGPLLPGTQINADPLAVRAKPSILKGAARKLPKPHLVDKTQPESSQTPKKHSLQASKVTTIPTTVPPKPSGAPPVIKPKHPVGSIVNVRWRGAQKPGGVGKVIDFFTTKVLSEILPFYAVEYVTDQTRDACIEGRFIEEYQKNLPVLGESPIDAVVNGLTSTTTTAAAKSNEESNSRNDDPQQADI